MKTIHHVIDIDAAPTTVWAAVTEHDQLAAWWSTEVEAPSAAVGARVEWTFAGDFNPVMEITESIPERRLIWRCTSGHANWQDNDFVFELAPLDDARTRLRFWQQYATELSDDDYGIYNFNWGYYMESLRLLCTTGAGRPFRPSP
jgi:uncharacterized protein YndB with AHSA1/START domain